MTDGTDHNETAQGTAAGECRRYGRRPACVFIRMSFAKVITESVLLQYAHTAAAMIHTGINSFEVLEHA